MQTSSGCWRSASRAASCASKFFFPGIGIHSELVSHQQSREEAVAVVDAGNGSQEPVLQCGCVEAFCALPCEDAACGQVLDSRVERMTREAGIRGEAFRDDSFVFFGLHGTGGVEQPSGGSKAGERGGEYFDLAGVLAGDLVFAQAKADFRIA